MALDLVQYQVLNQYFHQEMGAKVGRENWLAERIREQNMESVEPTVLIVGAGHCGLIMAARLKMLNISVLVIERNERVGDNWRNRYES